ALGNYTRFKPRGVRFDDATLAALPGLSVHDLMLLPIERCRSFFESLHLPAPLDQATDLLLTEIRTRIAYLGEVGLGYLTLDRQSRTLSGGEVQRINLTTALGTSLVNTLFVLDEPSIGLHPRDMGRVIDVMKRLREAGNSLVVVEHDPQIMFAADRLMDMGPGPGERGGEIVFFGTPGELQAARTLTADYLSGRKRADSGLAPQPPDAGAARVEILGATEHNLKNVDVALPLNRLVCVTGVSGSGKSTLVQDVLYATLLKAKGKPTETPGAHRALRGADLIDAVVMVDQTPIGKTTRSNPASYVGAFDAIRQRFAVAPVARERGYTAGTFSFNAGNGRCPTCGGNGFEHVEMQFLSDVYLRCPDCDGKRFRPEVLEVKWAGRSIADILELTVAEAVKLFAQESDVVARLQPLVEVGLEYLRLGQPVPTLSGGEAQRLKLAGHLAAAAAQVRGTKGSLFLFDEPTTGLHFDDVAKLLRAFRRLIDAGHSLVVIEHNLDVIRASDWILDLGPEGGDAGGEIVCVGTPSEVMAHDRSHTGRSLREYEAALARPLALAPPAREPERGSPLQAALRQRARSAITIHNAREHNLKSIDVDIPRDKFTVVTGVSGSGKSTLAFDIVFAEGQRRYLESLNAYARQFVQPATRPDVDALFGVPPTVAIEQRTSRGGRKSTVATLTEVYHFLRLLYMKLGTQYCPECNVPIEPQAREAIVARMLRDYRGRRIGLLAPLVVSRKGYYTDLAKWARGKGYTHLRVDGEFLPTDKWPRLDRFKEHTIELPVADLVVGPDREGALREAVTRALELGKGVVYVLDGLDRLEAAARASKAARVEVAL
ncbi:MAG TPA: excinuclease ABC subunit A, partial [Burkholderiales bacterium]|nr:excinuclease ABC subunit A [Burkholderiales bacterium]